ncbi:MAG: hypothetical protein IJ538_04270 [Clostridia bacterium]|nr:hypothetical protein [Clostridia bacterium]
MKKKNLFLSLICSILLTIALVTVTVVNVVSPLKSKGGNSNVPQQTEEVNVDPGEPETPVVDPTADYELHNSTADGTKENAYYIYDVESFNLLKEHGTENAYFEVVEDVDFAGVDYVTIFEDEAFNGIIISGNKVLKNIHITVTKANLESFLFEDGTDFSAAIAILGKVDGEALETLENEKADLEAAIAAKDVEIADLEATGDADEALLESLKGEKETLEAELTAKEEEIAAKDAEIAELLADENADQAEVDALTAEKDVLLAEYDAKAEAIEANSARITEVEAAIENLAELKAQKEDLENKLEANEVAHGEAGYVELNVEGLVVTITDEAYAYMKEGYATDTNNSIKQIVVAGVVGYADNATIVVNGDVTVNADPYVVYSTADVQAENTMGGVVAIASNTVVENSKVVVTINSSKATKSFVGGVAGYGYGVEVRNVDVKVNLNSHFDQALRVAGVVGFGRSLVVENAKVEINAIENAERISNYAIIDVENVDSRVTSIAGIVNVVRADNDDQNATIENVQVTINAEQDVVVAGVVIEVRSRDTDPSIVHVTIKDAVIKTTSNTNVLKLFAVAKELKNAKVIFTPADEDAEPITYIELKGEVLLSSTDENNPVVALFARNARTTGTLSNRVTYYTRNIPRYTVSTQIRQNLGNEDSLSFNNFGSIVD